MWNIAVCDDDGISLDINVQFLKKYLDDNKIKARISSFSSPSQLISAVEKEGFFDLYILDMIMDRMNGLQLGASLRSMGSTGQIIYISSSADFVFDAFSVEAMYYILKPVDYEKFTDAVVRAFRKLDEGGRTVFVKSGARKLRIERDSILYVNMEDHVITYHLQNGTCVSGKTVRASFRSEVGDLAEDRFFAFAGSGMVVNLRKIESIDSDCVVFAGGQSVFPPGKSIPELLSVWKDFIAKEG